MMTTDKLAVKVGDRVWCITGIDCHKEILEGVVTKTGNGWTTVKWFLSPPFEQLGAYEDGDNVELFGSEATAINILIYRIMKNIKQQQSFVDSLEMRLTAGQLI